MSALPARCSTRAQQAAPVASAPAATARQVAPNAPRSWPVPSRFEAATQESRKSFARTFTRIVYPDVDHAFHNDTSDRYNAAAARAAWSETIPFLQKSLG